MVNNNNNNDKDAAFDAERLEEGQPCFRDDGGGGIIDNTDGDDLVTASVRGLTD